jgi:Tol biopolymer transport system component
MPDWSPDGAWIAFISDRSGEYEVWLLAADGSGGPVNLTSHHAYEDEPRWAPLP